MKVSDDILMEALRLYQNDWKKTYHNSFMPDMYVFKSVLNSDESWTYIVMAGETLRLKLRAEKLKKITNKCRGLNML